MIYSAIDESTQARQNALVCQAIPGGLTSDSVIKFPLSTAPEKDNYMRVQRET